MNAITLWQPWASLAACGAKKFETRSWSTKHRGLIAIHAAAKDPKGIYTMLPVAERKAMNEILLPSFVSWDSLPRGCVVAIAELVECWKMEPWVERLEWRLVNSSGKYSDARIECGGQEELFGHWDTGRFAWELRNVEAITPIPAVGRQGLWNWDEGGLGRRPG